MSEVETEDLVRAARRVLGEDDADVFDEQADPLGAIGSSELLKGDLFDVQRLASDDQASFERSVAIEVGRAGDFDA